MSVPRTLLVVGVSHHRTPLEVRELFSLGPDNLRSLAERLLTVPSVNEVVLLNTCNRVEVYLSTSREPDTFAILRMLAETTHQPPELLEDLSYVHANSDMLVHLFSVTSGLDSQMIGETEILGQVKDALVEARKNGWAGSKLGTIFERSFQAAKWARTHTGIGQGQVTIGNVVVDLVTRVFGDVCGPRVLLVGSGEVAEKTAQSLSSRGARDITVSGRSFQRAQELAISFEGAVLPFETYPSKLHLFDIVICSTASSHPLLTAQVVNQVSRQRKFAPLLLVDVAVPRDVEAGAGILDQVFLYNMDDLANIANENIRLRREEVDGCLLEIKRRAWRAWLKTLPKRIVRDEKESQTGLRVKV
ncbi:MAG: glutamyl-tRNA reductase [Verrucomicrobiota bacterium]